MKNLPKSLHTVTVLVRMARVIHGHTLGAEKAVDNVLEALGYTDAADSYGLRAAAIAQLKAPAKAFDL